MTAPRRRGACPQLAAPMPTGDGLLARLHLLGAVSPSSFMALCRAARRDGNGLVEVTQRGSLQVRGLKPDTAAAFAGDVEDLGIAAPDGIVVQTAPLAGLLAPEPWDPFALAASIRAASAPLQPRLSPKLSVLVDAGGGLPLDALAADIRLVADDGAVAIGLGAAPLWVARVPIAAAAAAALRLLAIVAEAGRTARVDALLQAGAASKLGAAIAAAPVERPSARARIEAVGRHPQRNGRLALGLGLSFGQVDAAALETLLAALPDEAAVWTAPGRALLLSGLRPAEADRLAALALSLGLIIDAGDPRRHVAVCAGAPACASAHQPVRALAAEIATAAGSLLDGSMVLHLSGCPKGCAHPGAAALALVGAGDRFAVVLDGRADTPPQADLAASELPGALGRLADRVRQRRKPTETAAQCLRRLAADAPGAELWHEARHG